MKRWMILVVVTVAATGCQRSGYRFTEVEGRVTQGGSPRSNVVVCFWPDADAGTQAPRASAVTDADGHYRLRCDEGTNGAVVGRYRVCLSPLNAGGKNVTIPTPPKTNVMKGIPVPPRNTAFDHQPRASSTIPTQYATYKETPLRDVEVKAGETVTLDFDIPPSR